MKKPVLVIMAAGMGSRYGGLKQIDPVDEYGHIIMDFSLYDAKKAGFEKVVFIIKKENEEDFKEAVGRRMERHMQVDYVFQDLQNVPAGFLVPEGRQKPWGTGHAILSCKDAIDGPFVVINADDYYGRSAFVSLYQYLSESKEKDSCNHAMVGYILENTLTENGHVARGVCETDQAGNLTKIKERTRIEKREGKSMYTEDGENWHTIPEGSIVSMNMWGFSQSILKELQARFSAFLEKGIRENPLKCEYFLPDVVGELIAEKKAQVAVLKSQDRWYGVTYKEDKAVVVKAIKNMKEKGLYPDKLWEE